MKSGRARKAPPRKAGAPPTSARPPPRRGPVAPEPEARHGGADTQQRAGDGEAAERREARLDRLGNAAPQGPRPATAPWISGLFAKRSLVAPPLPPTGWRTSADMTLSATIARPRLRNATLKSSWRSACGLPPRLEARIGMPTKAELPGRRLGSALRCRLGANRAKRRRDGPRSRCGGSPPAEPRESVAWAPQRTERRRLRSR